MGDKKNDGDGGGCGCGCFGCLSFIAAVFVLWALIFGVTIAGRHHAITGCSVDRGVEFR